MTERSRRIYRKYKAVKTIVDGIKFDSKREADRYLELNQMATDGVIKNLRRQVKYELIPKQQGKYRNERKCEYIADYVYEQDGETIVEDCKGMRLPEYKLKRKLMLMIHGISILET